jgi:NADPH:quinone reductase-like Zn-dependent oxidoreductase
MGGVTMTREKTQQIPATMRAFAIDRFGDPDSFRELPTPKIGAGDILVRVCAAGINSIGWRICGGTKPVSGVRFPLILGQDAGGIVEQVGAGVMLFTVAQEVYGTFWLAGTFAEYVRVPVMRAAVAHKPTTIDFMQAAAVQHQDSQRLRCWRL